MTDYYQRFIMADAVQVYRAFIRAIDAAGIKTQPFTRRALLRIFGDWEDGLAKLSSDTARISELAIKDAIASTAKRAASTGPGGLMDHISSEPILGNVGVGVASLDTLDDLDYWRAQEYGLSEGFVGRTIRGFFFDQGFTNAAVPEQGRGDQALFEPDRGGGFGTIQHPIEARGFLEKGSTAAATYWKREQRKLVNRTAARITALLGRP